MTLISSGSQWKGSETQAEIWRIRHHTNKNQYREIAPLWDDAALLTKFALSFIYPFWIAPWLCFWFFGDFYGHEDFSRGKHSFLNPPTGFQIDPQPRPSLDHFHVDECLNFPFLSVCRLSLLMWEFKLIFFFLESQLENARTSPSNNQEAFFRVPK